MPEQVTVEQNTEPLNLKEGFAKYDELDSRQRSINRKLADLGEDDSFEPSDAVIELYESGDHTAARKAFIDEFLAAHGGDNADEMAALINESYDIELAIAAITERLTPVAKAAFAEKSKTLIDHIDWNRAVDYFIDQPEGYQHIDSLGVTAAVRIIGQPAKYTQDFGHLKRGIEIIDEAYVALSEFKKEQTEVTTEVYVGHGNLQRTIDDWITLTGKAIKYTSGERTLRLQRLVPRDQLARLMRLAADSGMDGSDDVQVPGIIADAYERAAAKQMASFDAADIALLHERKAERPNALMITGSAMLEKTTGLKNVPAFLNEIFNEWPDWMSAGIGFINILPELDEEHHDDEDPKKEGEGGQTGSRDITLGEWLNRQNALGLNARVSDHERALEVFVELGLDTTPTVLSAHFQQRIDALKGTIVHELTHNTHGNALPIRWLRMWAEAVDGSNVSVTPYITWLKEEGEPPSTIEREDLCESVRLYRYSPATLFAISAERFACLQALYGGYNEVTTRYLAEKVQAPHDNTTENAVNIQSLNIVISEYFKIPKRQTHIFDK